jgi:hypothetical protein
MSEEQIYVRFKGKVLGPLTLQKVQELARRGQITRMHDLSSDGISWLKAEEFGDVFATSRGPATGSPAGVKGTLLPPSGAPLSAVASSEVGGSSEPHFGTALTPQKSALLPRPGESPDESIQWYVHLNNKNQGPLNTSSLTNAVKSGQVTRETLIWRAGFDDWKPAAQGYPELFASVGDKPGTQVVGSDIPGTAPGTGAVHFSPGGNLYTELAGHRPWAIWLGAFFMTIGVMGSLFWVAYMVVGAETTLGIPTAGSRKVITGLSGLAISGLIITTGFLFMRYASVLKEIAYRREEALAFEAAKRMRMLLRFVGLIFLILTVLIFSGIIIGLVLVAGAGAGVV